METFKERFTFGHPVLAEYGGNDPQLQAAVPVSIVSFGVKVDGEVASASYIRMVGQLDYLTVTDERWVKVGDEWYRDRC